MVAMSMPNVLGGCTSLPGTDCFAGASDGVGGDGAVSPAGLPLRTVAVGAQAFTVEIASTPQAQQRGLMGRASLDRDAGMLFVFCEEQVLGFWMVNTLIPLDIAFLDSSGTILNIETMQPQTSDLHYSAGPARYALEVNAGEFARRGIQPGDRLTEVE